jgi:uncharacterized protein
MSPSNEMPEHGVGIVWWPELDPLCRPEEGLVQVIEAEPETFWAPTTMRPRRFTSRLAASLGHLPQPKLLHGVGAPFGGGVKQSAEHQETIAGDISALRPAWISDHLSFNRFVTGSVRQPDETINTGFLLPPAQCPDGVAVAAGHIKRRCAVSGVPVAFEVPVSYLPPRPDEMPDGQFVAEVAETADCGILLDLHNVLCNERNGRQSVKDFCASIPLERVWEIHLAGGLSERGYWLDAHSGLTEPALMEIVAEIVPRLPALGAIIFEIIPDYVALTGLAAIGKMLGQINEIWRTRGAASTPRPKFIPTNRTEKSTITPLEWEQALGVALTGIKGPELPPKLTSWLRSVKEPLELYRGIARENRASALVYTAPRTVRLLLTRLGEAETRGLLARFWSLATPAYTAVEEARSFLSFLLSIHLTIPGLYTDIAGDMDMLEQDGITLQ